MTTVEAAKYLNRPAMLTIGELTFPVTVTDVKTSYGQPRMLVIPVGGKGEQWVQVSSGRLKFDRELTTIR